MKAVIQAGGPGTRLEEFTKGILPKALVCMNGEPVIYWQLISLIKNGITEFIVITGYHAKPLCKYLGDIKRKLGVSIQIIHEEEPLGTGGIISRLNDIVMKDFLFIYSDIVFDFDVHRMQKVHFEMCADATILVHPNTHPYDSDLVVIEDSGRIKKIDFCLEERNEWLDNLVNAGVYIFSRRVFDIASGERYMDLEYDIIQGMLIRNFRVYGYRTPEYVRDVGVVNRFIDASEDMVSGIIEQKNLKNKQSCIFIDRDGTINSYVPWLHKTEQFELLKHSGAALRMLNRSAFLSIIVSNQPVVARGLCDLDDVHAIHKKMSMLLAKEGAYLDDIHFCPHHPDIGFTGENTLYKIKCTCRKPDISMIKACFYKYNIDPSRSWIVGDTTIDIQTGKNAGIRTALVLTGKAGADGKYQVNPDLVGNDLYDVVTQILSYK